jgi:biotin carboxyl carrier protein
MPRWAPGGTDLPHRFEIGDAVYPVWLARREGGYRLHVGDAEIPVALRGGLLDTGSETDRIVVATRGDEVHVHIDGAAYVLRYRHPLDIVSNDGRGEADNCVRAPMPGVAVVIHAEAGQKVTRGDALLVMESMKLETTIAAPRDGIVEAVHVELRQTFDRDAALVTLRSGEAHV